MTTQEENLAAIFLGLAEEYGWREIPPGSGELYDNKGGSVAYFAYRGGLLEVTGDGYLTAVELEDPQSIENLVFELRLQRLQNL